MKIGLVYYSFSGKTKRAIQFLQYAFREKNLEVETIEIKLEKEEKNFFRQSMSAFFKQKPKLVDSLDYDVASYDCIVFATPVWAFTITPALRSYLSTLRGLENKKAACLVTYGSGTGAQKALEELEEMLRKKNAQIIFSQKLPGYMTQRRNYLEGKLAPFCSLIS